MRITRPEARLHNLFHAVNGDSNSFITLRVSMSTPRQKIALNISTQPPIAEDYSGKPGQDIYGELVFVAFTHVFDERLTQHVIAFMDVVREREYAVDWL